MCSLARSVASYSCCGSRCLHVHPFFVIVLVSPNRSGQTAFEVIEGFLRVTEIGSVKRMLKEKTGSFVQCFLFPRKALRIADRCMLVLFCYVILLDTVQSSLFSLSQFCHCLSLPSCFPCSPSSVSTPTVPPAVPPNTHSSHTGIAYIC